VNSGRSHSLNSDADVAPPRKLTPAFYGCYDWHSSVHGQFARWLRGFFPQISDAGLPKGDKHVPTIMAAAQEHRRAGLAAVTGQHYEGGHWLGSFAVYLVTARGIPQK
jgi:hypothetical protein